MIMTHIYEKNVCPSTFVIICANLSPHFFQGPYKCHFLPKEFHDLLSSPRPIQSQKILSSPKLPEHYSPSLFIALIPFLPIIYL